jgi:hypothetical protein
MRDVDRLRVRDESPLADVGWHGKLQSGLWLDHRLRRSMGEPWSWLDRARTATWWRPWKLLQAEVAPPAHDREPQLAAPPLGHLPTSAGRTATSPPAATAAPGSGPVCALSNTSRQPAPPQAIAA